MPRKLTLNFQYKIVIEGTSDATIQVVLIEQLIASAVVLPHGYHLTNLGNSMLHVQNQAIHLAPDHKELALRHLVLPEDEYKIVQIM